MSPSPTPRKSLLAAEPWLTAERPLTPEVIALHRNENPYGPPPDVLEALRTYSAVQVAQFPDNDAAELRELIASGLRLSESQVLVGNGSTELQRMLALAYLDPGDRVGMLWPSSPYFDHIARVHGAEVVRLEWQGRTQEEAITEAPRDLKILFVASPNTPFGQGVENEAIVQFAHRNPGTLVVIDEAYEAFRRRNALQVVKDGMPNVVLTRSFSKTYGMAGLRVGYLLGQAPVMADVRRVMAPYCVNGAALAAAAAAWGATQWLEETVRRIVSSRETLRLDLQMRGFEVPPSEANFLFVSGTDPFRMYRVLRDRNILVKTYEEFELRDGARISVGTEEQLALLISTLDHMLSTIPRRTSSTMIRKLDFSDLEGYDAPIPRPEVPGRLKELDDELEDI